MVKLAATAVVEGGAERVTARKEQPRRPLRVSGRQHADGDDALGREPQRRAKHGQERAAVYIEEYALSHGLRAGDALVAVTAAEHGLTMCTGNAKHFRPIRDLEIRVFKP